MNLAQLTELLEEKNYLILCLEKKISLDETARVDFLRKHTQILGERNAKIHALESELADALEVGNQLLGKPFTAALERLRAYAQEKYNPLVLQDKDHD